jgi:hypothetical protein
MSRSIPAVRRFLWVLFPAVLLAAAGCGRADKEPAGAGEAGGPEARGAGQEAGSGSPAPRTGADSRPAAPKPAYETVRKTVPAGTRLQLTLESELATDSSATGEEFEATLAEAVRVDGLVVLPAGSRVRGEIEEVRKAKKLTGGALMRLAFREILLPGGQRAELAASLTIEGPKTGKKSAAIIGGSTAGGAVLGRVVGEEGKDAAIGGIIGGAIGAGVAATRDKELRLTAGSALGVDTEAPLRIPVKVKVEG